MSTKRIPISFSTEYLAEYEAIKDIPNRSAWICEAIREKLNRKEQTNEELQEEIERMNERIKRLESIIEDSSLIKEEIKPEVINQEFKQDDEVKKKKASSAAKAMLD